MSEKGREAAAAGHSTPAYSSSSNGSSQYPPPPASDPNHTSVMTSAGFPSPGALQSTAHWTVVPNGGCFATAGVLLQGEVASLPKKKSLLDAYTLAVPLGFLGAHHFYLGRIAFGITYFFTFGLLGCGWLIDLLRLPCLVASINKASRDRYEQLQQLRQQQQQRWMQQQQCGSLASVQRQVNVTFVPFKPRSLADAYILWFPFGFLGFHHFYLRNHGLGIVYLFTFGLLGIGWLVDLFRMPSMVRDANSPRLRSYTKVYRQGAAHAFALSPAGIFGAHHFYLNRPVWGCLYLFTLGLVGVGWVYDWFRTSCLVKRANAIARGERSQHHKYVDDAYILCLPFGFTGLHHFYLRRYGWGFLYFCTLGIFGIGWLVDWCRLPSLVKDCNAHRELSQSLISAGNGSGALTSCAVVSLPQVVSTTPMYPPAAGYGTYHPSAGLPKPSCPPYGAQGSSPPSYESTMKQPPHPTP